MVREENGSKKNWGMADKGNLHFDNLGGNIQVLCEMVRRRGREIDKEG
jgi:hypothetical protein